MPNLDKKPARPTLLLGFEQTVTAGSTSTSTSVTHQYNLAGDLLGDGLTTYRYDSEGRMESASTGQGEDAPTTKYAHNGLGQRVFKTEPLYASSTGTGTATATGKNLNNLLADDDEPQGEPPGLIQQILNFFSKLWSPSTSDAEKLGFSYVYAEDGSLLGEYGSGGSNSTGTAQYSACGVARCPAQKTASFRPGLRCKSARYLRVSLWFAPCPDQKSIGFQRAAQRATPHDLPTASGPMPIAAVIKGQTYAVHSDHLNTPRKLTQPDGQVAWQWAYSAFGDEQPTIGAKRFTSESTTPTTGATSIPEVTFNLRYPGQYFDPETKLHYNYFRTYAPGTGRYTQGDPIGLDGGWNRFAYVDANPLYSIDFFGLRDYSEAETRAILAQERFDALTPLFGLGYMLNNHRGGGKMDFGPRMSYSDTFDVGCGKKLRPYQFGNYITGYGGVYFAGPLGYLGARAGGLLFNATGGALRQQKFDWDMSSAPEIDAGARRAYVEIFGDGESNG